MAGSIAGLLERNPTMEASGGEDVPASAMVEGGPAHNLRYRPDIDGLRAIAVVSVVLYHLGTGLVPGGFAGVDVFFVISGYLITGAIHREIVDGTFTVRAFYERRIRRIFPALIAMLLTVTIAGLLIQFPEDLRDLGTSIAATATFCSNILFWMTTNYFAAPAETKPLLHTWSLAVEEQFYVVVPLLMVALHRWLPRRLGVTMLALAVVSFACSCIWTGLDETGNYYLPHTRAWELLTGSLVALGLVPRPANQRLNELLALLGLVLLIAPFFLLSSESVFPAWNALATCIGTAILIRTGEGEQTVAGSILANRLFVGIGLISYSLYLVHWPIIVFAEYMLLREPHASEMVGLGALMFLGAYLSWRFIERPFRSRRAVSNRTSISLGIVGSALLAAFGGVTILADGFPQRLTPEERALVREEPEAPEWHGCFMQRGADEWGGSQCFLTHGSGPVVLLWGDSHAYQYENALLRTPLRSQVLLYASAGCPPILNATIPHRPHCRDNNSHVLEIIRRFHINRVVLSAYWERVLHTAGLGVADLSHTITQLRAMNVDVRVLGDNPDFPFSNPRYLALRLQGRAASRQPFYVGVRNTVGFNDQLRALVPAGHFFDPMQLLCHADECLAYENGQLLMQDNSHLANYGAGRVLRAARSQFE